jgi:chitooligosaccharide deacetylase
MGGASGPVRRLGRRGVLAVGGACLLGLVGDSRAGAAHAGVTRLGHTSGEDDWRDADPRALVSLATRGRRIALTFDDGPDPAYTPQVLDLLAAYRVPATFFMIGRNAVTHPDLVRRVQAEGHLVANHTRDHVWLDRLDRAAVGRQLDGGAADLVSAGASVGGLMRPPRGWTSPSVAEAAGERRLRAVFWTVCLEAHLHAGPARAVRSMGGALRPGAIVLCHDGGHLDGPNPQSVDRSGTVAALPALLERVRALRLRPVTLPGP